MSSGEPDVPVVLITHNRVRELLVNLERLTSLPEAPRVVVVDNGSTDGTAAAVRARHPTVHLIVLDRNAGAIGRNIAVDLLRNRYVAFADDDTWWEPGSLRRACDVLDEYPDVAVVTARIVVEPSGQDDPVVTDMRESPLEGRTDLPGRPLVSFLAGASVIRREAFQQVGGFHPALRIGGEEELVSMDLMAAGWHLRYLPDITVHHAASPQRDPHRRRADGLRNTLWCTWMRRPLLRALGRTGATLRRAPKDLTTARAVLEALAGLPWVIRERRPLPTPVERQLRLIDAAQLNSSARRYVS